jgi:hypothetical protein
MNDQQQQIDDLKQQVANLAAKFSEEGIRDVVFFDRDAITSTIQTISIGAGGGSADVPKNPTIYLRIYFRGKVYNIPAYTLS